MAYVVGVIRLCTEESLPFEVLASGFKDIVESEVVWRLTPVVEYLCQSLNRKQNKLIDEV